tara:strand:+ start:2081 stop:2626 length:546 start_codon:yes stop_codon:yes gene_type:complete
MNFNNLFKIFLKKREKSINVNIVNNYNSYYEDGYHDDNYFDNIYNVSENDYYQEYNAEQPYEISSHENFFIENIQYSPLKHEDITYYTQVEEINQPSPKLSNVSRSQNDLNIRSISNEDLFKDDSEYCSICLSDFEEMKTITLTNCHHKFHFKCIKEWLSQNNRCPLCNEDQTKLKRRFNF